MLFAGVGATPPVGWFLCDGQEVNRITFSALFAAIGVLYGVGDGSTTFNLPKFDDNRKARGAVNDAARGTTGGANTVTLTGGESGTSAHTHTWTITAGQFSVIAGTGMASGANLGTALTTGTNALSSEANADDPHENQSLFVDVNYIIHV